ncbi:MAG: hypothetical protein L7F77_14615 [Candidatus Magnetominusculus sp. LBB02]|nr:hypothetical protein [Candidatus Magnetominusculus sp. LBB02]
MSPAAASIAGAVFALGMLSHGNIILSAPALLLIVFYYMLRRKSYVTYLIYSICFLICFLLLNAPWSIYKLRHPEINTNSLIAHYVPYTLVYSDGIAKPLSVMAADFLREYPLDKQIERRWSHLRDVIDRSGGRLKLTALLLQNGDIAAYLNRLYAPMLLFVPITPWGEVQILLSSMMLIFYLIKLPFLKNKTSQPPLPFNVKMVLALISSIILNYTFHVSIKWTATTNLESSYTDFLLMIIIISGISFSFGPIVKYFSLFWVVLDFAYYIIASSLRNNFQLFDFFNIAIFIGAALMVYLTRFFIKMSYTSYNAIGLRQQCNG